MLGDTIKVEIVYEYGTNEIEMNQGSGEGLTDNSQVFQFDQQKVDELDNTNIQLEQFLDNYQITRDRMK